MFEILEHPTDFVIVGFHLLWWHRHKDPLKLLYTPGRIHVVTHQKTIIFLGIFFPFVSVGDHIAVEGSCCRSYSASTCVLVGCIPSNLKHAVYLLDSRFESWAGYVLLGGSLSSSKKNVLALTVGQGSPKVLWQTAILVTLGWFAGHT